MRIVRPEIEAVTFAMMWKIRNAGALVLRCTVRRPAPGPVIVRFLLITNSPLVRVTAVRHGAKLIVSPDEALRIACRNEPAPMSFPFVTVMVAADVPVALNKSAAIAQAPQILLFVFISFSILLWKFLDKVLRTRAHSVTGWLHRSCHILCSSC